MKSAEFNDGYLVRCDIGDEVVSILSTFAEKHKIHSGTITGIGAIKAITLGYFDLEKGEYLRKEFPDTYELLSLSGNFAVLDGKVILHCHALISDRDFNVQGGHLFGATVAVTGEFYIRPGNIDIGRGPDDVTGLNLIKL